MVTREISFVCILSNNGQVVEFGLRALDEGGFGPKKAVKINMQ